MERKIQWTGGSFMKKIEIKQEDGNYAKNSLDLIMSRRKACLLYLNLSRNLKPHGLKRVSELEVTISAVKYKYLA